MEATNKPQLTRRFVATHLLQTVITFLVIGGVLFISAGRWDWWEAR